MFSYWQYYFILYKQEFCSSICFETKFWYEKPGSYQSQVSHDLGLSSKKCHAFLNDRAVISRTSGEKKIWHQSEMLLVLYLDELGWENGTEWLLFSTLHKCHVFLISFYWKRHKQTWHNHCLGPRIFPVLPRPSGAPVSPLPRTYHCRVLMAWIPSLLLAYSVHYWVTHLPPFCFEQWHN